MTRGHVFTILKLAIVAALMTWVFTTIQWEDAKTRLDVGGKPLETVPGAIDGPWDGDTVRFRVRLPDETLADVEVVRPGQRDDGTKVAITPGFWTYLKNLDKLLFLLGALCFVVTVTLASSRWWWLLRANGLQLRIRETLRFTWIGVFFNNVVPGLTGGDVVKALYIMKRCPGSRVTALMSVVVDRILGLGSLALLGAIAVLFYLDDDQFLPIAAGIWGLLLFVCAIGVFAFSRRVRRLIRLDQLLRQLPARLSAPMMRVDAAIHSYRDHKSGVLVWLLIGTLNHCITVTSFVLMGHALGVGMPISEYFVLIPVILVVTAVPLAPNGWGVGEWLFGSLFSRFGAVHLTGFVNAAEVMRTRGVALSLLYRIHTTMWSLIGGFLMLTGKDRISREEVDAEIAREQAEDVDALASAADQKAPINLS